MSFESPSVESSVGGGGFFAGSHQDRTNYFQNVPTSALDMALWMESDRMGHLLGAIDQAKLDEQRGVVQNEKRAGREPALRPGVRLPPAPDLPGQPSVLLDHDRLHGRPGRREARRREGVVPDLLRRGQRGGRARRRHRRRRPRSRRWSATSATSPPGPPVAKQTVWIAKRTGHQRGVMQDRVPQARVYKIWNIPEWGSPDLDYLNLASDVLSAGQDVAAVQASGVRRADRHRRGGRHQPERDRQHASQSTPPRGRATTWRKWRRRSTKSWRGSSAPDRPRPSSRG